MEEKLGHSLLFFVIASVGLTDSLAVTNTQIVEIPDIPQGICYVPAPRSDLAALLGRGSRRET